jgi:hypothetical protein
MKRVLAPVACILFTAAVSAQEKKDDFRWDPKKQRAPAVGDRFFVEREDKGKTTLSLAVAQQEPDKQDLNTAEKLRLVREVLEVEKGVIKKEKVTFERYEHKNGDATDKSLEGACLVIGHEKETRFEVLSVQGVTDEVVRANQGTISFAMNLARPCGSYEPGFGPDEPVAPDTEFKCAPSGFYFAELGSELDEKGSSGSGKVTKVHVVDGVKAGHLEMKIRMKLKEFPYVGVAWSEGGTYEIDITADRSLEQEKSSWGELKREDRLTGKVNGQSKNTSLTVKGEYETATTTTMKWGMLAREKNAPGK